MSDPTATRTLIEHRDDVRLDAVDAFVGHLVVSYRSEALPRIQLWPLYADGNYGRPEDFTFESELMSAGLARQPQLGLAQAADRRDVVRHPGAHLRRRPRHRRADAAARTAGARRLPPRGLRRAPRLGGRRGRRAGAGLDHPPRRPAVPGADTAVRLRRLRIVRGPAVLDRAAVAAGPRHGVRHRPRARRRRAGPAVVRARQAAGEDEHLHRLHRRGSTSRRHRRDPAGEPGRARRQRGRAVDRCGGQHGAAAVRRASWRRCRSSTR